MLGASGSGTLIAVIVFLLVIGGIFNALDQCGLMRYILTKTASRFSSVRYRLMAAVSLFFMALGAMIGSFEECVPLVPLVVALSVNLGWDALTGVGMSLLAAGCGFASGICKSLYADPSDRSHGSDFRHLGTAVRGRLCLR